MLLADFRETAPGVFHAKKWGLVLSHRHVEALIACAQSQAGKVARLCLHPDVSEIEQQMLIAFADTGEGRAHLHPSKREALVLVSGEADLILYDDMGEVSGFERMQRGGTTYVSIPAGTIHNLDVREAPFVFWELALGPFLGASTVLAPWSA